MRIKGFRVGRVRSQVKSMGVAYSEELKGALFLAPTKLHAQAWAVELGRFEHLYLVEVEALGEVRRGKWGGYLKEIIIFPPYKIIRWERIGEVSVRDALLANRKLARGRLNVYVQVATKKFFEKRS